MTAGRHRGAGHGRYAGPPPRHAERAGIRLRPALVGTIGTLTAINVALGGLLLYQADTNAGRPVTGTRLPTISIPVPPIAPNHIADPQRARRQAAKARPPVLLPPA